MSQSPVFRNLAGLSGQDPHKILAQINSPIHQTMTASLSPEQVLTLANFLSYGQHDMASFFAANGDAVGEPLRGKDIFEGTCQRCHGANGTEPIYGEPGDEPSLGWLLRDRREQAVHKIRNGVPSADMLSLRFLEANSLADLFAYLQRLDPSR